MTGLASLLAISSRWKPVSLLEISYEVAYVINSHQRHYFFKAQERFIKQLPRTVETQAFKILCWRQTGFVFEQVAQARRREVDGRGERIDVEVTTEIFVQQIDGLSHTWIHEE